jgi:hypothetical protein
MCLIIKSFNVILFLLTIELIIIFLAFFASWLIRLNFIYILIIGVLEAILGLTLLISYLRSYGSDFIFN